MPWDTFDIWDLPFPEEEECPTNALLIAEIQRKEFMRNSKRTIKSAKFLKSTFKWSHFKMIN